MQLSVGETQRVFYRKEQGHRGGEMSQMRGKNRRLVVEKLPLEDGMGVVLSAYMADGILLYNLHLSKEQGRIPRSQPIHFFS
jgi:hypothetical protein